MVINLDPFNHNSYNEGMTPQRVDNTDEFHNDSRELSNDEMENFEGFPVNKEEDLDAVVSIYVQGYSNSSLFLGIL